MFEDIIKILAEELEISVNNVTEQSTLFEIGMDSITFMTMIIYIEEKYNIEFSFDGIFMEDYKSLTFEKLMETITALLPPRVE